MIKTDSIYSVNLKREIRLDIRYVDDFEHVLFCLDGQNMFFEELASFNKIWHVDKVIEKLESDSYKKTLIIGVWSNTANDGFERFREYSVSDNVDLLNSIKTDSNKHYPNGILTSKGVETIRFFKDELIPYIESVYYIESNIPKSILGSSMGGLMSLAIISQMQDYFTNAFCLSNAFWYNYDEVKEYFNKISYTDELYIYLDCGTKEDTKIGATNKNYLDVNQGIYELLKGKNVDVTYNVIENGIHDENSWFERLPSILLSGKYD